MERFWKVEKVGNSKLVHKSIGANIPQVVAMP